MITAVLFALAPVALDDEVVYTYEVPEMYIEGEAFDVTVTATVSNDEAVSMPVWALTPAAFDVDGIPLIPRDEEETVFMALSPGQRIRSTLDLGPTVAAAEGFQGRDFRLGFRPTGTSDTVRVIYLKAAEKGMDFMSLPREQLSDYDVVLQTTKGEIWLQLWADVAPNHARNFLDLAYSGFYDDSDFHRVIPGFMVQGGGETPGRPAPRHLRNEFNDRRHVPGVLSMARLSLDTQDEDGNTIPAYDSATSEFFVMHAVYPSLDGKYTAFGKVVLGLDVVEDIVSEVKDYFRRQDPRTHKPRVRQVIHKAIVVKAPTRRPTDDDQDK